MKAIILAATVAALSVSVTAPLQAASLTPVLSLEQLLNGSFDRGGPRCDNPAYAATHPRCSR